MLPQLKFQLGMIVASKKGTIGRIKRIQITIESDANIKIEYLISDNWITESEIDKVYHEVNV